MQTAVTKCTCKRKRNSELTKLFFSFSLCLLLRNNKVIFKSSAWAKNTVAYQFFKAGKTPVK